MSVDVDRIRAMGPWILVNPEPLQKMTPGGIYLPDGNTFERIGHVVGRVISAGKGYYKVNEKTHKEEFIHMDVNPGERVVFRGYLKNANKVNGGPCCFMHAENLIIVLADDVELSLALPYDN